MTTDTQQLAADIAKVMELDAKQKKAEGGEWKKIHHVRAEFDFAHAAPLMADIIRRQQELLRELVRAALIVSAEQNENDDVSWDSIAKLDEALARIAPLLKEACVSEKSDKSACLPKSGENESQKECGE